jgi:hypothetical protein
VKEFWKAFFEVQKEMPLLVKRAVNPHHKSKYPDLLEVITTIKPVLHKHGMLYYHAVHGDGDLISVTTVLMHVETGQSFSETLTSRPDKPNAQAIGSLITYMKRYMLVAMLGLAAEEDDDGNKASGIGQPPVAEARQEKPAPIRNDKYLGTPKQKTELVKFCNSLGLTDIAEIKKISAEIIGKQLSEVEALVIAKIEQLNKEPHK